MTQQSSSTPTAEAESPAQCRHHWIIQAATGPVQPRDLPKLRRAAGVPQLCGSALLE